MPKFLPLWLGASLFLAGCVNQAPPACPSANGRTARVLFVTDRKKAEPARANAARSLDFSGARSEPAALQLGWQRVTLGAGHRIGLLDSAVTLAPAEVQSRTQGPPGHPMVHRTDAEISAFATSTVRTAIRSSPPPPQGKRRQVLLFVHGFNNSFDYAVRKTAQLAADLEFVTCEGQVRGVPIMYSWPSQEGLFSYLADEENVEWTQQRMVPFLKALATVCREEGADLHIIAHSMGGRLVVRSLSEIATGGGYASGKPLIDQVIFLAPDIGRGIFTQYIERILPLIGHLTVYVSAKDRALTLSGILHGGHQRLGFVESTISTALRITGLNGGDDDPRDIGQFSEGSHASQKIDMIDVTGGVADFVGHSYEDPAFIHDLQELIYRHTPPDTKGRENLTPKVIRPGLFGLLGRRLNYFELRKEGSGIWPRP